MGFRPLFHRLATAHGLDGFVRNDSSGVSIEVEGEPAVLDRFLAELIAQHVFARKWRGIDTIPSNGYTLSPAYHEHDAAHRFAVDRIETHESPICISGRISKGIQKPHDCAAFGNTCTPQNPLGATMVSSEGACAANLAYGRHLAYSSDSATRHQPESPVPTTLDRHRSAIQ